MLPRNLLLHLLVAYTLPASAVQAQRLSQPSRLIDDVKFLSDDRLQGRMTGSPGADSAAAYLARRFSEVGLQPAAGGWFQSFTVGRDAMAGGARQPRPVGQKRDG